ncbi:MAG TPA: TonB family protein [Accumulibacter sp.]|uniref:energy transducer TonB n=1 Tax=Accumulibacter sp. TaxID=2053492 RepID=UPI002BE428DE|nr:TonB family protein [Accumulibacter sp.]HRF73973.1 TonB family protein [Accumulibacter sp.]
MNSLFPGSHVALDQRKTLLWALAASLSLHLVALAMIQVAAGSAGARLAGSPPSALVATLRGPASRDARGESEDSGVLLAASRAEEGRGQAAEAVPPEPDSRDPVEVVGQRRLAAYLPPYLSEASSETPVLGSLADSPLGPWYFPRSHLTRPVALLDEPQVTAPPRAAGEESASGKVVLRVFVGAGGAVERIDVASSTLPAEYDAAAVAAFSRLRFRPGEIEGVAVTSEARFEIAFAAGEIGSSHVAGSRAAQAAPPARLPTGR